MASLTTSAQCSASDSACRSPPRQVKQVRPKLPLLKILQTAGAQGEIFTVTQVMHYLGQYITMKQLYDPQEQHMVYCNGDLLGELLGCQSFSVKDPSPLYAMLRRNLVALTTTTADAAQTLAIAQDQNLDIPSQDQLKQSAEESSSSRKGPEGGSIPALPTLQCKQLSRENEDLIENLTQDETSRLDLGLEEWDVAGLPWWFLGNLRNNYTPRSNASTDLQTNRDVGTAIVSDTTDDVWFLNESVSEQFGVGLRVEAAGTEQTSEEVGKVRDKMVIEAGNGDDLEDTQSLCDDTDVEVASEDEWQCTECKKFNSPSKRYCFRCWALRKDWYSDCSKLAHSLSTSDITAIPEEKENEGIDVPDCRRTISAPVVIPKDRYRKEENPRLFDSCTSVEFLDLVHRSESQETVSSMGDQSADLFKRRTAVGNMEDCGNLLKPCSVCEKRPRDGNIIHGKTSHLVTCFHCARRLKKVGASCPICKKEIQLVIRVFIA
ncbi:protein Mdm4 isoform X1 [Sturnira hondurensis]|uniref:protein Mdm4 isoform X1 n=1 Tax=Sturnira hondurensis TaxID=192404 RepID=UPI0018794B8B|nr:protein Mdm4 isoform X1 [Sturnira hondurensis]XP_036923120.1 protein Mdm4 isoform X1 [Sturnira hondurensis]XP_036923121.1 protein Mdm4 isoform X1 [Sturnira hondurensis]